MMPQYEMRVFKVLVVLSMTQKRGFTCFEAACLAAAPDARDFTDFRAYCMLVSVGRHEKFVRG